MIAPFPDPYLVEGVLAFGAPAGGTFAAGWYLELPDLQTASYADQNRAQDALVAVLHQLPEGWRAAVQWWEDHDHRELLLDYQARTQQATRPATRFIRNANFLDLHQRLERGELRRKRLALYVGRTLPVSPAPWSRTRAAQHHAQRLLEVRAGFAEWERSLNQALATVDARAVRMDDRDLIRRWSDTLNPSLADRVPYDPAKGFDPQHTLLANCWHSDLRAQGRQGFLLDGYCHGALVFKRLPSETYPTLSHRLTRLPFGDYTVTVHLRRLPRDPVLARTQRELDRIHQQLARKSDERLAVTRSQVEDKVRRLASGDVIPLEIELILIVRARTPDELSERAALLKSAILDLNGAQYYEASLPATARNLFAKTLPGWLWSHHRSYTLYGESRYVADLLLMAGTWAGHPGPVQSLFPGADGNLVNVVNFLGEGSDATPQNRVFLGATGTGKSLVLNKELRETELDFAFTAILEEGLAHATFSRGIGVEPVVFRLDGAQTLNVFDTQGLPLGAFQRASVTATLARMAGVPADEDRARRQSALLARHVAQLYEEHAQDRLRAWSATQRQALLRHAFVLHRWAAEHRVSVFDAFLGFREFQATHPGEAQGSLDAGAEAELREFESRHPEPIRDLAFAYLGPEEQPTLSAFREHLELAEEDEEACRWLAALLLPWCRGGNCGLLFDGPSNVGLGGAGVHFELGYLPEASHDLKGVVGFLAINSLRQHILTLPRAARKRVVIEEVSRFLDLPGAETIVRELFEQFRKFNCQVLIVAQSYSRLADTPIRVAVVGNSRAWTVFNPGSREDVERLGRDIGLSPLAQETILRFPRPDQQSGAKYSEFLYFHTDVRRPVCGPVRYVRLPEPDPSLSSNPSEP